MLANALHAAGLRSVHLQVASLGSIALCLGLWVRAKTVDQEQRDNAERRALFVGLWPPMLWLIGDSLQQLEDLDGVAQRLRRRSRTGCRSSGRGSVSSTWRPSAGWRKPRRQACRKGRATPRRAARVGSAP
jgi:hypothetical protein